MTKISLAFFAIINTSSKSGQRNPEGTVVLSPQTTKELKQRSTRVIYYDHGRSQ